MTVEDHSKNVNLIVVSAYPRHVDALPQGTFVTPETTLRLASSTFLGHDEALGMAHHQLDRHSQTLLHLLVRRIPRFAVAFVAAVAEVGVISISANLVAVVAAAEVIWMIAGTIWMTATCSFGEIAHLLLRHDGPRGT